MTTGMSSDVQIDMNRSTYSYDDHPSQTGELFVPSGSGPFRVVVVVHGGYWKAQYDRSLMDGLCADLAAHGLAAWNIEYRRVGAGGGWPQTFLDVGSAVDLLADLDAPLDLSHVGAVGHSAGGQLALLRRRCGADAVDRGQALGEHLGRQIGAADGADGDGAVRRRPVRFSAFHALPAGQTVQIDPRIGAERGADVRRGDAEQAHQLVADAQLVAVDDGDRAFDALAAGDQGRGCCRVNLADRQRIGRRLGGLGQRIGRRQCDQ